MSDIIYTHKIRTPSISSSCRTLALLLQMFFFCQPEFSTFLSFTWTLVSCWWLWKPSDFSCISICSWIFITPNLLLLSLRRYFCWFIISYHLLASMFQIYFCYVLYALSYLVVSLFSHFLQEVSYLQPHPCPIPTEFWSNATVFGLISCLTKIH